MTRRLFNVLTLLSLLPCAAVASLWARRGLGVTAMEWVTPRGACWQVYSARNCISVIHISDWSESSGIRSTGYSTDGPRRDHPVSCLDFGPMGGARHATYAVPGLSLYSGALCVVVDSAGKVKRMPPYLSEITPQDFSPPLPFWQVAVRHEAAVIGLALLPAVWLVRVARLRIRTRSFTRRGLCPRCGYDQRATPGRCPECGTVAVAGRDAKVGSEEGQPQMTPMKTDADRVSS